MKFASAIHFRPRKSGFWPPAEVENPFLQEMDVSKESGIPIPLSFEGQGFCMPEGRGAYHAAR